MQQGKINSAAIEIHPANFAGDVTLGWESQLLGCMCGGMRNGELRNEFGNQQNAVLNSQEWYREFCAVANGEPLTVIFQEASA